MKLNPDTKQRLITVFIMFLEFYKILMGTFLVIFVPQNCEGKICTIRQNFFNGNIINYVGNIFNFVTFSSILILYFIEISRENWCIQHLDIDDEKSTNNLDKEIENYPDFKIKMKQLNINYIYSIYTSIFFMLINFVISGATIYQSYAGINSITTFLSFFMLVFIKLYNSWTVSSLSIKNERANSAYMKEPKTYNTIDIDYKKDKSDDKKESNDSNINDVLISLADNNINL
jgi:hypothetical protein